MLDTKKFRPNRLDGFKNKIFKGLVLTSFFIGTTFTLITIVGLGKFYLFDNPKIKAEKEEYYQALLAKERKEKELGFKN